MSEAALEGGFGDETPAIIATDFAGTITHWNDGAERLYGWPSEEALGRPVIDLTVASDTRADAEARMAHVRRTGLWEGPLAVLHRRSTPFEVHIRLKLIADDTGRAVGFVGRLDRARRGHENTAFPTPTA